MELASVIVALRGVYGQLKVLPLYGIVTRPFGGAESGALAAPSTPRCPETPHVHIPVSSLQRGSRATTGLMHLLF